MRYLFIFEDGTTFKTKQSDLKRAIWEVGKYIAICEYNGNLFKKSLNGFDDNDIDGIVDLFNYFCSFGGNHIREIYEVKKEIWSGNEED